jgi:hypothetical protein
MKQAIKLQQMTTLKALAKIWEKYPDYRLGQLIGNVFPTGSGADPYHMGDSEFIRRLEAFYDPKKNPIK